MNRRAWYYSHLLGLAHNSGQSRSPPPHVTLGNQRQKQQQQQQLPTETPQVMPIRGVVVWLLMLLPAVVGREPKLFFESESGCCSAGCVASHWSHCCCCRSCCWQCHR